MNHFVHITGSVPSSAGPKVAALVDRTAYETAQALLRRQIGVVALVGASSNDDTVSFDDVIVKAAADHIYITDETGIVIRTVRHRSKWTDRINAETREHLERLRNHIKDEVLSADSYTGGAIRAAQADLSDGAIIIGGYRGVKNTADLLLDSSQPKPVEEILVKGLSGGLPEDLRSRIDETRDWNSAVDNRTVQQDTDCARVANWVAERIATHLQQTNATSNETQASSLNKQNKVNFIRWTKICYDKIMSSQLAAWVGNLIRFFQNGSGGN